MGFVCVSIVLITFNFCDVTLGLFRPTQNWLRDIRTTQRHYGIAASDVDNDGHFDWIVAGFDGPNLVLSYDFQKKRLKNIAVKNSPYAEIMDEKGQAIGVCACDIDGDGREEIYVLNTNDAFAGTSSYSDKLFKWRNGSYVDLFSDPANRNIEAKNFAGRSVACIDRYGSGRYSFVLAAYADNRTGQFAMIEYHSGSVEKGRIVLRDVADEVGIARSTGGRGIVVGPILGYYGQSDIYFGNENSPWIEHSGDNYLFKNLGNGSFEDVGVSLDVADGFSNARGMTLGDYDKDGFIDIVVGNWNGYHRLFLQNADTGNFRNVAKGQFATPSLVRTVMSADFNNDGITDIFFNNFCDSYETYMPNRLFSVIKTSTGVRTETADIGTAEEAYRCGTGGNYADVDSDGRLDLILSHADSASEPLTHPLTIYTAVSSSWNKWIRVEPLTVFGAPARGALVRLYFPDGSQTSQVIDGGSGYLCQMEPVAHFGLGATRPNSYFVQWPDGRTYTKTLNRFQLNRVHTVEWSWSQ